MSAAAPSTTATSIPDLAERILELDKRTAGALKETALKAGVAVPVGNKKTLVGEFAKSDAFMRVYGWPVLEQPTASTGNIDGNGDIVGERPSFAPTPGIRIDDASFPIDGSDVDRLNADHLEALKWALIHEDGADDPGALDGDTLKAWVRRVGYQVPGQETLDSETLVAEAINDAHGDTEPDSHIPTTAPTPTTQKACTECSGNGGFQTDTGWESCGTCCADDDGQLTLVPGGDAPAKSILNIGSLRYDLGSSTEFKDGDTVRVSFDVTIDKIAFIPEKSGKQSKRRVRTHAGAIDQESVSVELA